MVRERQSARPRQKAPARPKAKATVRPTRGSIWDTPRVKAMLAQPVGSPIDLTPTELQAILQDMIDNPPPYDAEKAERDLRELRKIRRESGALLVRPDSHD
jgi:hypothetical protein